MTGSLPAPPVQLRDPAESVYWEARADELAEWALARLVARTDVCGRYFPVWTPEGWATETYTWPRKDRRGTDRLTPGMVEQHFRARNARDVLGLHAIGTDQLCPAAQLDLDNHGGDPATAAVNWRAALAWFNDLTEQGLRPLLSASDGKGGYHLRVLFARRQPAPAVLCWLRHLIRDYRSYGLSCPPECFPKQPALSPAGLPGRYGNWLRLIGRHPKRDFWAKVWDGEHWLSHNQAIDLIVSLDGDAIDFGPVRAAPAMPRGGYAYTPDPVARAAAAVFLEALDDPGPEPASAADKARAYIQSTPAGLGEGHGRDDVGFRVACVLVCDNLLTDAAALPLMREWDARNAVPKGEPELRRLLDSARKYGGRPRSKQRGSVLVELQA
jgi:hypothetical protein